ncbi:MAG: zeta toxin family protein [Candidatus Methanomethylophilaceae archaeon]|nr:zeta toxin family protein [Candidatus Methanomethylophilaceae archaeon]
MPRLYVIVGPNGSGKSSIITNLNLDSVCKSIINPDNFARRLSDIDDEVERYILAMRECEVLRERLLTSGVDFGFETVGSRDDKLEFMSEAREKGYSIILIFVTTSDPDINVSRVAERVRTGGHDVPEEKIRSRYERTMSRLKSYLALSDEAIVIDNSGDQPVTIVTKDNDTIRFTADTPDWVLRYLDP